MRPAPGSMPVMVPFEAVALTLEVLERVDVVHVGRHGDREHGALVVRAEVLEVVLVLIHVRLVSDLGPCRREHVHVATGERGEQGTRLGELLHLDGVADLLELVLGEVGHAETIGPGRKISERDLAQVARALATGVSAVSVGRAARQYESSDGADADDREQLVLLHHAGLSFLPALSVPGVHLLGSSAAFAQRTRPETSGQYGWRLPRAMATSASWRAATSAASASAAAARRCARRRLRIPRRDER